MHRELHAPGSVFCPSTSQKPLCQRLDILHTLQQLQFRALCISVPALTAGMASLSAPQPGPSSPHSQPEVQPNRQANRLDAGNPAIQLVVLNSKQSLASNIDLEREQRAEMTALEFAARGCKKQDG